VAEAPRPTEAARPSAPEPEGPAARAPAQAETPASGAPSGPQVAAVPPARETPPLDIRSFGRGGGAGGRTGGRGGISGEPIPLDSSDPNFADYLERLRRKIYSNWGYPCVKNATTRECEYMSAEVEVEFGILRDGKVQYIEVRRESSWTIYDDYAVTAIKLSSPFPTVPAAMMARMNHGSTGIIILGHFTYTAKVSLRNLLR